MPAIIPVILNAAALAAGLTTVKGLALLAASIAFSVGYGSYERRKQRRLARDAWNASLQDRLVNVRSTTAPKSIAYGHCIVGGVLSYAGSFGPKKENLYLQLLLGPGHEIAAVDDIKLGDVWLGTTNGAVNVAPFGRSSHVASSDQFAITQEPTQTFTLTNTPVVRIVTATAVGGTGDNTYHASLQVDSFTASTVTLVTTGAVGATVYIHYEYVQTTSLVDVEVGLGYAAQAASSLLHFGTGGEFALSDRGVDAPWLALRLGYDETAFPAGVPIINSAIRGAVVYDPRTSTTGFSANPALCLRHYLQSSLGLNAPASDIDDALVIAAANICDEELAVITYTSIAAQWTNGAKIVTTNAAVDPSLLVGNFVIAPNGVRLRVRLVDNARTTITLYDTYGGTTQSAPTLQVVERRYECHGVIDSTTSPYDAIDMLTSSMAGVCVYAQGQWRMYAGAYTAPVVALDDRDMLLDDIVVQARPDQSDLYNQVRVTYADLASLGQTIVGRPVTSPALVAEDGGRPVWLDMTLPMTATGTAAYRLAVLELNRARQALTVSAMFGMRAYRIWPGERLTITSSRYGWTNKVFRVLERRFDPSQPGVHLVLREDAAAVYTAVEPLSYDVARNTTLPVPWQISPPVISVSTGDAAVVITRSGAALPRILVTWTLAEDRGGRVEVQWRRADATDWISATMDASAGLHYIDGVTIGIWYVIRARLQSSVGARSDWSQAASIQAQGKTSPPPDVSDLAYQLVSGGVLLLWAQPAIADYAATELRVGAFWETGSTITRKASRTHLWGWTTAGDYTIWARHIDTSGNYSANAASLVVTIASPTVSELLAMIDGPDVRLTWSISVHPVPIREYVVQYHAGGSNWIDWWRGDTTYTTRRVDWLGARTFRVFAVDIAGNAGAPVTTALNIPAPLTPTLSTQVLTNRVLISSSDARSALPIAQYELRKGPVGVAWASASTLGVLGAGRFAVHEEPAGATLDLLVAATDTAGNIGGAGRATVTVVDPPAYVRYANYDSYFTTGTLTDCLIEQTSGRMLAPFAATETETSHYSSRSWNTDQAKIDAGYSYIAHPTAATGTYQEDIDVGITIAQAQIAVSLTSEPLVGSVTVQPRISYRATTVDPWIDGPLGDSSVIATNFRYVRVRYTFTSQASGALAQYGVLSCVSYTMRISGERKTDSGVAALNAGDTNGTLVTFNRAFDLPPSVTVTPLGSSALLAVVDSGSITTTGFRAYLYSHVGVRQSGNVSWNAEQGA